MNKHLEEKVIRYLKNVVNNPLPNEARTRIDEAKRLLDEIESKPNSPIYCSKNPDCTSLNGHEGYCYDEFGRRIDRI
jgi:hypothetical protein